MTIVTGIYQYQSDIDDVRAIWLTTYPLGDTFPFGNICLSFLGLTTYLEGHIIMNNSNQATRQNSIVFTGNVSQVKPLQNGGAAISLAYNEGSMINGQWETKDTLFLESYLPAKLNFIPNVGDKMTISGFMASNNYQPQGGKKKFGVRLRNRMLR